MKPITTLAFLLCAFASLYAVMCDNGGYGQGCSGTLNINESRDWFVNNAGGCTLNVTVDSARIFNCMWVLGAPSLVPNGHAVCGIDVGYNGTRHPAVCVNYNGGEANTDGYAVHVYDSQNTVFNGSSCMFEMGCICASGGATGDGVRTYNTSGNTFTCYHNDNNNIESAQSTTVTDCANVLVNNSDGTVVSGSSMAGVYGSLGVQLSSLGGTFTIQDSPSAVLTNITSGAITIVNSTHTTITGSKFSTLGGTNTAIDITDSNITSITITGASVPGGGVGAGYFTRVNSTQINLIDSPTSMTDVNLQGQLYVQDTDGVQANLMEGSMVNSPTFINSEDIVFNPHCSSDNTQTLSVLCGSGTLTLDNVSSSVFANFIYSAIDLNGSDSNTFNPVAFGTLVLRNSSTNTFTGAGANDTGFTPHASKVELYDSNGNTIEKMSLGTTCTSGYKTTSYIIGSGSNDNIMQDNYFKENCADGAEGQYTVTIANGSTGNQITGNIFEMAYQIVSDNNPLSADPNYNQLDANAYGLTINGSKNISGNALAMSYPYTLYYGSDGSDYPYNATTSSGDIYNLEDARPLTSLQGANATSNLSVEIIQPTLGQQINGTTFTTIYNVSGGTNTHGCYIAAKPSIYEYYPYQYYVNCSSTSYNITVVDLGKYNLVLGAYDDTGGLVDTTTFELVGNGTSPPSNGTEEPGGGGGSDPDTDGGDDDGALDCIPYLTCPSDDTEIPECTPGVDCPWDLACAENPDLEGCSILENEILAGAMPWIASLDASAKELVLSVLVTTKKAWWLLVAALLAISGKDVMDKRETTRSVVAFASAIVIALIFMG